MNIRILVSSAPRTSARYHPHRFLTRASILFALSLSAPSCADPETDSNDAASEDPSSDSDDSDSGPTETGDPETPSDDDSGEQTTSDNDGDTTSSDNSDTSETDSPNDSTNDDDDTPTSKDEDPDDSSTSPDDDTSDDESDEDPEGLDVLGKGSHSMDRVKLEILGDSGDGLMDPTDVEIHPTRGGEAWVTNRADDSIIVFYDVDSKTDPEAQKFNSAGSRHFLARPAALSFADDGFFTTAQEEDEKTQGNATPADFMGPTLWLSNTGMFDGGQKTHYDMLHNSPNSVGVAWEVGHVYWIFDGYHNSLTRYNFNEDHGPGGTDHTDGTLRRYVEGEVRYVPEVVSHLVYHHDRARLYVADAGNSRLAVLDPSTGEEGETIEPNYDNSKGTNGQRQWVGAELKTLVDGSGDIYLPQPSGLTLHDEMLFVSDHEASYIYAFTLDGEMVDWLDTELPSQSLQGLSFDAQGRMYVIDGREHRLLRISALE